MFCQAAIISARQELTGRSFGGGQPNINAEVLKTFRVPLPPVDEQAVIVHFLDKVKTDVDTMIDGCQREINLIREYRTRLIADVVTGKLDVREAAKTLPNADLSSSVGETDIMQAESKAPKVKFGSAGEANL